MLISVSLIGLGIWRVWVDGSSAHTGEEPVAGPAGLHPLAATLLRQRLDVDLAVEVGHLVLEHLREDLGALDLDGFALRVHPAHASELVARCGEEESGHRQAAFFDIAQPTAEFDDLR